MTTKLLIIPKNGKLGECHEYFVHDYHEYDLIELLLNYEYKNHVGFCDRIDNINWITIELNNNFILGKIKTTNWFKNTSRYNPELEKQLDECYFIEMIHVTYEPRQGIGALFD